MVGKDPQPTRAPAYRLPTARGPSRPAHVNGTHVVMVQHPPPMRTSQWVFLLKPQLRSVTTGCALPFKPFCQNICRDLGCWTSVIAHSHNSPRQQHTSAMQTCSSSFVALYLGGKGPDRLNVKCLNPYSVGHQVKGKKLHSSHNSCTSKRFFL